MARDVQVTALSATAELPIEGALPELDGATAWLNSEPLTPAGLRGKVVVVQFCTFSCMNWLRTLPYVRAWAEKYRDDGLVVLGPPALRHQGASYPTVAGSTSSRRGSSSTTGLFPATGRWASRSPP